MALQVIKYQIRASGLQPKGNGCPTGVPTEYIYQTFGATKTITDVSDATTEILKSEDMQGLKPGDEENGSYRSTTYTRASYSGRAVRTTDGDLVYTAQEDHVAEFIDENDVPGWE
jgi:hypothetical protein